MHEPAQLQAILLALILMMFVCGVVPLAIFGGWMFWFGGRVRAGARFPPADAKRWKSSRVLEGDAARSRGTLFRVFGVIFELLSIVFIVMLWRLWVVFS